MRTWPVLFLPAVGCATMTGARPLDPGQHALGVTFGGGLVDLGAPIPLPNLVVEGRHGLPELAHRPFDLHYGVDATALAFGVVAVHGGASWLLLPQHEGWPALALTDRVFFAIDPDLDPWAADQVELTASWLVGGQLPYLSLSQYTDFGNPTFTLTPAVGAVWDPAAIGGVKLQTEVRWYGVSVPDDVATVSWVPGTVGILGVSVGFSAPFGGAR